MLKPSIIGMEPPFADAFQNYSFADQALTSTDLLATSSDPDFMYEMVSYCTHTHTRTRTRTRTKTNGRSEMIHERLQTTAS